MAKNIKFGNRSIGVDQPVYVIAEIGSNHNGDMALCRRIIDAAKRAGADAVKFQSWSRTSLISTAEYERNTGYTDKHRHFGTLKEMVERYEFTPDQHREIAQYCKEVGIDFMSSAFAPAEVDLVHELNVPAFKVASMDVTHLPLLKYIASKGRPVILSTGMATLAEIEKALQVLKVNGDPDVVLLHCVSAYPTPPALLNLRNLQMLAETFGVQVGFSDHSLGHLAAVMSVGFGSCVIEKHFTIDKELDGWDHHMSADEHELKELVEGCRFALSALGRKERVVSPDELEKRKKFRRRAVARTSLPAGTVLSLEHLDFKRPGTGIGPDQLEHVVGRVLVRDLAADEEVEWRDVGELRG